MREVVKVHLFTPTSRTGRPVGIHITKGYDLLVLQTIEVEATPSTATDLSDPEFLASEILGADYVRGEKRGGTESTRGLEEVTT